MIMLFKMYGMRKNLFLLFLLAITANCVVISQTVTVSEELALRSDDGYEIIGKMSNRFLLFRLRGGDNYEVQAFDEKLRLSWKKEIILDKKNPKIIDVIPQKDNFVVIYQYRRKGKSYLKAAKYDPAANLTDSISFFNLGNTWYTPDFNTHISEDRKKIVLSTVEKQSYLQLYAFDVEKMEFLWENNIRPDKILEPKASEFFLVDNNVNCYYIQEKDNRKTKLDEHRLEIYKISGSGSKGQKSKVYFLDKYMAYDIDFSIDNRNNNLVCAGLYSENSRARANGIFTLTVDNNLGDADFMEMEFDPDFLGGLTGQPIIEDKGISEIDVSEIIKKRDGGLLVLLERNRIIERRSSNGGRGVYSRDGLGYIIDYYYDDIIALSFNPSGELLWQEIFHKKQYSQDDGAIFSSYFLFSTPSQIKLIFNDDIKTETTVSEYIIKASGYSDRNAVFSTSDQDLKLRFRDGLQLSSTEFMVPSERRNRLRLVRVSY